jgi:hypothetical protein
MENIITLLAPVGELLRRAGREPEVVSQPAERRALIQAKNNHRVDRAAYVVGLNRQAERIYSLATLAAVTIMVAALIMAFGVYLSSFVA